MFTQQNPTRNTNLKSLESRSLPLDKRSNIIFKTITHWSSFCYSGAIPLKSSQNFQELVVLFCCRSTNTGLFDTLSEIAPGCAELRSGSGKLRSSCTPQILPFLHLCSCMCPPELRQMRKRSSSDNVLRQSTTLSDIVLWADCQKAKDRITRLALRLAYLLNTRLQKSSGQDLYLSRHVRQREPLFNCTCRSKVY